MYKVVANTKQQLTVMACMNAISDYMPPMIVYPGERLRVVDIRELTIQMPSTLRLIEQTQHKLQTAVQFIEQFLSSSTVTYIYCGKYKKTSEYVIYVHVTMNNRHDFTLH